MAQSEARVAQYSALARFKEVAAPFDGTITERRIDVGNLVTAGSTSATTPLFRMSQSDPLRVFVDVPQSLAAELMQPGLAATVTARDARQGAVSGVVARSAGAIDAQARTMRVEVDIANAHHDLVPGMYVSVNFALQPRGLVAVPAAALLFRAGGPQVAIVDKAGTVQMVPVVIARDDGSLVELASGVKPGERLALNISSQISAGQRVTARDAGSTTPPAGGGH